MSWLPVLILGVWNAWLLYLFVLLHPLVMNLIDRTIGTGNLKQKMRETPDKTGKEHPLPISSALLIVLFVISLFIPLRSEVTWLTIGLVLYFIGIAIFLNSIITAAKTSLGHVFSRGMYRYSRHPLYLSFLVLFLGISVASLSWIFLLLSMLWMIFPLSQVTAEEQGCLDAFGIDYQEYMSRTPKWLGIPKPG